MDSIPDSPPFQQPRLYYSHSECVPSLTVPLGWWLILFPGVVGEARVPDDTFDITFLVMFIMILCRPVACARVILSQLASLLA